MCGKKGLLFSLPLHFKSPTKTRLSHQQMHANDQVNKRLSLPMGGGGGCTVVTSIVGGYSNYLLASTSDFCHVIINRNHNYTCRCKGETTHKTAHIGKCTMKSHQLKGWLAVMALL